MLDRDPVEVLLQILEADAKQSYPGWPAVVVALILFAVPTIEIDDLPAVAAREAVERTNGTAHACRVLAFLGVLAVRDL